MTEGAGVGGGRDGGLTIGEVVVGAAGTEGGGVDMRGGGGSSSAGPERMLAKDIGSDLAGFCKKKRKKKSATKYPTRQDKTYRLRRRWRLPHHGRLRSWWWRRISKTI